MARLYSDEDFPDPVVAALRQVGHDVLTVREAGNAGKGISDADVLAFAIAQNRAVLTHNSWDFLKLHSRIPVHCGIIICTRDADTAALTARIHHSILSCPILDNQLVRVIRPSTP